MKKLAILFMLVFVLPVYPQDFSISPYWYNLDTSKDTLEIDGKMYIHTPQYDTLFIPDGTVTVYFDGKRKTKENGQRYLILEDIKNLCSICNNKETEKNISLTLSSSQDRYMPKIGTEFTECTLGVCKSCGNIYVARKQVLRRIE